MAIAELPLQRDPLHTLNGCERILILGRTGSGKTTLARELAAALGVPHVELDSLYFGPDFTTAPLPVLRERTSAAIGGERSRTSALRTEAARSGRRTGLPKQLLAAAKGVLTALRSHRGQRREYPRMFARPENRPLAVARLRSPHQTRQWLTRVTEV